MTLDEKYEVAKNLLEDEETDKALDLFKELAKQDYLNSGTYVGYIFMCREKPEKAVEFLRSALILDTTGCAHFYLADILEERGDFTSANELYLQAAELGMPAGYYRIGLRILEDEGAKVFDKDAEYYFSKGASLGHFFCWVGKMKIAKQKSNFHYLYWTFVRLFWLLPKLLVAYLKNPNDERLRL